MRQHSRSGTRFDCESHRKANTLANATNVMRSQFPFTLPPGRPVTARASRSCVTGRPMSTCNPASMILCERAHIVCDVLAIIGSCSQSLRMTSPAAGA